MRIEVTQEQIDKGRREDCTGCPVALALKEATGRDWGVDNNYLDLFGGTSFDAPPEVDKFVAAFDAGHPVKPFSFEVPI